MNDSAESSKRHRRRTHKGATGVPKETEQSVRKQPPRTSRPEPTSRVTQLLAQLAVAQSQNDLPTSSISFNPIPQSLLPKMTSYDANHLSRTNEQTSSTSTGYEGRKKEGSVGDRMAKFPPPSNNQQRKRHTSTSMDFGIRGPRLPEEVLDDISFRFILNVPESEKRDETRICFQMELAHWFYVDYYVNQQARPDCHNINMRDFLKQMFVHNDFLRPLARRADEIVDNWRNYKSTVPTYGAVLLDSSLNYVLLVQGYYASKNSWGFPKGKVNESEAPRNCAIREVLEETGFDFGECSNGKEQKIQKFINDTMVRLYIVTGVPTDYHFQPKTRCEIRQMKWFSIWDLPSDRNDQVALNKGFPAKNFYGVVPFVQEIQWFVRREQTKRGKEKTTKETLNSINKKNSAFTKVEKKSNDEREQKELNEGMERIELATFSPTRDPTQSLFRPLATGASAAPLGSHLATILAASSPHRQSNFPPPSSIAHPVAIRPPSHRPVYMAPKETQREPVKGISSWDASVCMPSTSSCSASQLEDALQRMLLNEERNKRESESSDDGEEDEEIEETMAECIPQSSIHNTHSGNGEMDVLSAQYIIMPLSTANCLTKCLAWDEFHLNREAIFNGPPFFT